MQAQPIQESPAHDEALWTKTETARFAKVSIFLVDRWVAKGNGPRYIKINGHLVRFRPEDVRSFIESQARGGNA
jgi:hypothetical protein